ncbi:MAG: NUDIX hydrolase [Candidatus Levybacteria bacterium]|nr:NUDIX hydrolase [Candidatus Levybacteria bacterium]
MPEEITSKEIPGTMETVGVLIFNETNDKALLVKHTKAAQNEEGIYGIPAGQIEIALSESPKEATLRELMEETGLVAREEDLEQFENNFFGTSIIRTKTGELKPAHMRVYHCKAYEGELRNDRKTIPEWVEIDTINKWAEEDKDKELWEKKKLMPNVDIAIHNYLESQKTKT